MNKLITVLIIAIIACAVTTGCSKTSTTAKGLTTREQPMNACPLDLEIGYANKKGVQEKIGPKSALKPDTANKNEYSNGVRLIAEGKGLGLEGVSKAFFLFDDKDVLVSVVLVMDKTPGAVTGTFNTLVGKYQVVDKKINEFMNYGTARLSKGESIVLLEADHLANQFGVVYTLKSLDEAFNKKASDKVDQEKKEKANKL
jgi:hypothetical protein